ncbi:ABC transporter substrate-binding protein [Cohnella mopanensis]|uniref:ABC transporter substrate-binding protein n=1 Tax=Cohnella mopanensis TaxID=2911966 RepID=UPI001EF9ABE1|nr:extracellular solute-binding protein [Cohnella mopanensis]
MSQQRKLIRKWVLSGLTLSLLVPTLAACNTTKGKDSETRHTLRVGTMYGSKQDETWFRQQFTDIFEFTHSNIDIEVVPAIDYSEMQFEDQSKQREQPDPLEKVKAIMTGSNPVDVMIFDMSMLNQLVNENMLKQLDPMLKENKMDTTEFVPAVIDGIKDAGNGFLYALTPTFTPSALYYNKKIFTSAGVNFPTDGMSWEQVFTLAKRLKSGSGKDAIFGFSFNQWGAGDSYWDMQTYAAPLQMRVFDDKAETMTVNTPQWESVWKTMSDLYNDHVTPRQEDMQYDQPQSENTFYNPFQGRLFLNGKVAMSVGDYSLINEIQQLNDNSEKLKMEKLDWDVVTMPYHIGKEDIGGNVYLSSLSGINVKAANPDDAWEFVKFMNGKDWAKLKSRSTYELSARKDFVKVRDGMSYNVEAFTKMKPAPQLNSTLKDQELYREKPNLQMVSELGNRAYAEVIQGKKTVKEALAQWETKGNDLLQKIKLNPKGEITGVFDDGDISPEKRKVMEAAGESVQIID